MLRVAPTPVRTEAASRSRSARPGARRFAALAVAAVLATGLVPAAAAPADAAPPALPGGAVSPDTDPRG